MSAIGTTVGALLGTVPGLLITWTGVNSFIGTLAAAFTYLGFGLVLASGGLVRVDDAEAAAQWRLIVQGTDLGLKGQVWIALLFVLILSVLLSRTVFGRQVYAGGGVSIFGGIGAVWLGMLGVFTFAPISNGLNLLGVDSTYRLTILGVLIFVAVAADQVFRRKGA